MQVHEDIFLLSLLFRNVEDVFLKGRKADIVEVIRICKGLQAIKGVKKGWDTAKQIGSTSLRVAGGEN